MSRRWRTWPACDRSNPGHSSFHRAPASFSLLKSGRAAAITLALIIGACASSDTLPEPEEFHQAPARPAGSLPEEQIRPTFATYNPQVSTVFPDYRLNVGDVLEVIYHVRTGVTPESYRIKVEDVISITFPFQPKYDQTVTVQSDGTIRLLLVGEIVVVKRGEPGISAMHFRRDPDAKTWLRYNPATREWQATPLQLTRATDGAWMARDPERAGEARLEEVLARKGPLEQPIIVDWSSPGGRSERDVFDLVQRRWKPRPIFVEQVGMTAAELQEMIKREYAKHLRSPEMTVTIKQANIKIEELKKAITTAPRGQSRLMPVKPDGTIDLPFVGEMPAFGKTIQQLKSDVEAAYAQVDLPEISVTIQMNDWAQNKIFVLGEVNKPGLLTVPTSVTLVQAIAAAGGVNVRAESQKVLVIRRKGLPVPEATIVDLGAFFRKSRDAKAGEVPDFSHLRYDFYLSDTDIVYVPTSGLAQTGDWVDAVFNRIIRGVVPYNFYAGLNFGYELHRETSVNKTDNDGLPNVNVNLIP